LQAILDFCTVYILPKKKSSFKKNMQHCFICRLSSGKTGQIERAEKANDSTEKHLM